MADFFDRILGSRFWALFLKEVSQILHNRQLLIQLLLPPTIMLTLFGFALNPTFENLRMGITDYSHSRAAREFVELFSQTEAFDVRKYYGNEQDMMADLAEGKLTVGITIPPEFDDDLARRRPAQVQALFDAVDANTASVASGYLSQLVDDYNTRRSDSNQLQQGIGEIASNTINQQSLNQQNTNQQDTEPSPTTNNVSSLQSSNSSITNSGSQSDNSTSNSTSAMTNNDSLDQGGGSVDSSTQQNSDSGAGSDRSLSQRTTSDNSSSQLNNETDSTTTRSSQPITSSTANEGRSVTDGSSTQSNINQSNTNQSNINQSTSQSNTSTATNSLNRSAASSTVSGRNSVTNGSSNQSNTNQSNTSQSNTNQSNISTTTSSSSQPIASSAANSVNSVTNNSFTQSNTSTATTTTVSQNQQGILGSANLNQQNNQIQLETTIFYNPGLKGSWFIVPGTIGIVLTVIGSQAAASLVVREKEAGTIEQLIMTPASNTEIILAKIAPLLILLTVDAAIAITVGKIAFNLPFRGNLLVFLSISVLYFLVGISIGIMIASYAKSEQQAQLTTFFINPPLVLLSGGNSPIAAMPTFMQWLSYLDPMRYFIEVCRGVLLKGVGLAELWPQVLILLVFAIALMTLSIRQFRHQLT